ncbi:MAG: tRNA (guanosine(46)-N7)-methyltransferase TrmB [Phycisphaerales bacterium]|nr:tRNA (guanosine(46)-N7)-methyltransferase TrmB [Phycisphaerales bacterium]
MSEKTITIDDVIVEAPIEATVVDPADWFDTPGPVELEIGCGKGGFLLARAQRRPELRLVGIEWANQFFRFAADRMARWGVTNVRIMRTDAGHFVKTQLASECLSALHVYHPDPWPKKRHHKRRLIQPPFVEAAVRALQTGARWAMQTDHDEYFEQIQTCLRGHPALMEVPYEDESYGAAGDGPGTNYELKYRRGGRIIHQIAFVKCG